MEERTRKFDRKDPKLTEKIDFCMLTTIDAGHMRSRPMSTQQTEFDGDLCFLPATTRTR
jgi:general stress protein 26